MAHSSFNPLLALILIFTLVLVAIGFPVNESSSDHIGNFKKTVVSPIRNDIQNGNAVYGIAPTSGQSGCKSFSCPFEQVGVRTPITADNVAKDMTAKKPLCICVPRQDASLLNVLLRTADLKIVMDAMQSKRQFQGETAQPDVTDTDLTYVPPPKTDITPDLLAESLKVQPQDTATVGSLMPHFQDGVISYGVQLNGLVAATMTLNASTSLPCANIGGLSQAQPDLMLRPKDIDNGTAQAYIPDCNIVAVNMYDPNIIHYWVMNKEGAIFSLVGSNKVMQINQLNSTASISLVLRATSASIPKRNVASTARQNGSEIVKRALSQPDLHTASMTAEACAAMKCNNNGGQAAVFNPFTKTCWCRDPVYVEIEHV